MDLNEQLKPLAAEADRTGVPCLPEWLLPPVDGSPLWACGRVGFFNFLSPDAARLIAEACIVRFLAGPNGCRDSEWADLWYDDASLQSLIAAAMKVYATLPDAGEGGA